MEYNKNKSFNELKYFWINNLFYYIPFSLFIFAIFQNKEIGKFFFSFINYQNIQDRILLFTFFQSFMLITCLVMPGGFYSLIDKNLRDLVYKKCNFKDRLLLSLDNFFEWIFFFPAILILKNPYTGKLIVGFTFGFGFSLLFWIINFIDNLFRKEKFWYFIGAKMTLLLKREHIREY